MAAGKGGRLFGLGARPAKIGSPSLTAGDNTDTFSWSAPNNNGLPITKYGYQTSTDNGSNWSAETETANLSAVINTQYSTSAYKIRIRAFNAAGYGEYSDISTGTAVWISNTGTETDTDTVCGPAGCSDTENVTETDTENVTETDTDTACGPAGCSEAQGQYCNCGAQYRFRSRTSSRSRTRTRSRDRTRVRSRTRTRTSSRTRTRSTQFYSRSGSTSSGVTYGSYSAYTDYTYSAYGAYGAYSYTAYTAYGAYYYSAYSAYGEYDYTAWGAYGAYGACDSTGTWSSFIDFGGTFAVSGGTYSYVTGTLWGWGYSDAAGNLIYNPSCGGLASPGDVQSCNRVTAYRVVGTDTCIYPSCC